MLVKAAEWLSERLAEERPGDELAPLLADARRTAQQVEAICRKAGSSPASLPDRSRRAYAWLRFLSDPDQMAAHVVALGHARDACEAIKRSRRPRRVELSNIAAIWRWRRRGAERVLLVSEGFLYAPPKLWQSLVAAAAGDRDPEKREEVRAWTETESCRGVTRALTTMTRDDDATSKGRVHDLAASFERVNTGYFEGTLERPALGWSSRETVQRFGSYKFTEDRVTLSKSLDADDVPTQLVDFVVFHELLHKVHGATRQGTRRAVHTAAFRADEARFKGKDEAEALLNEVAKRRRKTKER
jgi:hypothetical protein